MHRVLAISLLSIALLIAAVGTASAESLVHEGLQIEVTQPSGWTTVEAGDQVAFNFRHDDSQSQIEVIGTRLITPDVASIFFETFHTALRGADFSDPTEEEKSIGPHNGLETVYEFQHSGVDLRVSVFQFVQDDVAWLVVGYIEAGEFEIYAPVLREVIASLSPVADEDSEE